MTSYLIGAITNATTSHAMTASEPAASVAFLPVWRKTWWKWVYKWINFNTSYILTRAIFCNNHHFRLWGDAGLDWYYYGKKVTDSKPLCQKKLLWAHNWVTKKCKTVKSATNHPLSPFHPHANNPSLSPYLVYIVFFCLLLLLLNCFRIVYSGVFLW